MPVAYTTKIRNCSTMMRDRVRFLTCTLEISNATPTIVARVPVEVNLDAHPTEAEVREELKRCRDNELERMTDVDAMCQSFEDDDLNEPAASQEEP
jgi:hypothetical protein